MTRPKKPCSVCGRPDVLRKGMCSRCYQRWRVHGDPLVTGTPGRKPKPQADTLTVVCPVCWRTVALVSTTRAVWAALDDHQCRAAS